MCRRLVPAVFFLSFIIPFGLVGCASSPAQEPSDVRLRGIFDPETWTRANTSFDRVQQDLARCKLQALRETRQRQNAEVRITEARVQSALCMEAQGYQWVEKEASTDAETLSGSFCVDLTRLWATYLDKRAQGMTAEEQIAEIADGESPETRDYAISLIRAVYRVDPAKLTDPERTEYLVGSYERCKERYD